MKQTVIATFSMHLGSEEIEVRVSGHYIPGQRGARNSYGVPEKPDDEDEIQVKMLTVCNKRMSIPEACEFFDLTEEQFMGIVELEMISALDAPDPMF